MYTLSVSSDGTMTPESSAACSPIFSDNVSNETQQPHIAQDGDMMEPLAEENNNIKIVTETVEESTPIDPFKLRYHLQRTLNTTAIRTSPSTTIQSNNSPLYSPITSPRTPPIPINDPTDDLNSDTPIYKTEDGEQVDQAAVFGELHHTSSEDLMDEIYSGFTDKKTNGHSECGALCQCGESCECAGCTLHGPNINSPSEDQDPSNPIRNTRDTAAARFEPIIDEDGVQLCGCGCSKSLESCRDCFQDLCEGKQIVYSMPNLFFFWGGGRLTMPKNRTSLISHSGY
ncbi:hypothetical protein BGW37DRAFT_274354 [Umbelopsis sp. PMI_123]|nr:hypothetical protein BGW37DRAFT_274354 [Umbelopsis sp. PMI_123]